MASPLLQTYDPDWKLQFQRIQDVLSSEMSEFKISFEHIGSTSVPGLIAKPIIDLDMVYESKEGFNQIKDELTSTGYEYLGDLGIVEREVFVRRSGGLHPVLDGIDHHLYACHTSSGELKRHIVFRDYLRVNEWARDEYEKLKMSIAKKAHHDHKVYAGLKVRGARPFVETILARAQKEK